MVEETKIALEDVKMIAALGRLSLTDDEIEKATKDLTNILGHFSSIQSVDTVGVPTADDVSGLVNVQREDKADNECLCETDDLLKRVPRLQNRQVKVEAVFDERN